MEQQKQLSTEEEAIYDRQIRIWGHEVQQKLKDSKILVLGV